MKKSLFLFFIAVFIVSGAGRAAGAESLFKNGIVGYDQKFNSSMLNWGFKKQTRDFLTAFGFRDAHTQQIIDFMKDKIETGAVGSIVVMNNDGTASWFVGETPEDGSIIRDYLEAGGTVLWYGDCPGKKIQFQLEQHQQWGADGSRAVIGIDATGDWKNRGAAEPTAEGRSLGLRTGWDSTMPIDPALADSVLALTESGYAAAWTLNYKDGAPGFVRIWDKAGDNLSDDMAVDLFTILTNLMPGMSGTTAMSRVYLHEPSEYYRLVHREGGTLEREIRVSTFNAAGLPGDSYALSIKHGGAEIDRVPLGSGGTPYLIRELRVKLYYPDQDFELIEIGGGTEKVLASAKLDEEKFFARETLTAEPIINPIDLGYVLVPPKMQLAIPSQTLKADFWMSFPGSGGVHNVTATLAASDKSGKTRASGSAGLSVSEGEVKDAAVVMDCAGLKPGRYMLEFSLSDAGENIYSSKRLLIVPDIQPAEREFGAYFADIEYPGEIGLFDYDTKKWVDTTWKRAWQRGPDTDVVVSFPNGNRFIFWRGSGYVPFWASWANSGLTYEWLEAGQNRGVTQDAVEPLQDKECRYSRSYIRSSTPARAVIDWRYALIGRRYVINKDEWGDETYTFYPDGFGVRKITGYFFPMSGHESAEFINLFPGGINPFDVYPPEMFRIMSPDGKRRTTVTYPRAHGEWTPGEPAVFRVNYNRRDSNTPVLALRAFESFGSFFDGWKVDGRYICPNYWGIHFPLQRGYPTTRQQPPDWEKRAAHASLAPIQSQPFESKTLNSRIDRKVYALLIGNTTLPDDYVLNASRSWIDPVELEIISGAVGGGYDPYQRGYALEYSGGSDISLKFKGGGADTVFNPVFIIGGAEAGSATVTINGVAPGEYRAAMEREYNTQRLVIWIGEQVPADAEVSITLK